MKNKVDAIFLILICGIFLIVVNIYNFKTEKFSAPDEFGHFEYIRFLNNNHHFPTLTNKTSFWEAHQPPLYYLFLSPIDLALKNRISIDNEVRLLRFVSSFFGVLSIIFAFLTAKLLFKGKRTVYYSLTLAFSFWPMFLFISGVLNNDSLANLLGIAMIYCLVKYNKGKYNTNLQIDANQRICKSDELQCSRIDLLICGMIAGLAFLTKLTLYPVAIFFLIIIFWKSRHEWRNFLKFTLSPALIICFV